MEIHPALGTLAVVYLVCVLSTIAEIIADSENDMTWREKIYYTAIAPITVVRLILNDLKQFRQTCRQK